jgi:hypothetical protein
MKKIPLTRGEFALVDDKDYDKLKGYKWQVSIYNKRTVTKYARRAMLPEDGFRGKRRTILMHRQILGVIHKPKKTTDHINNNGLDNRRENLRFCNKAQNNRNKPKYKPGKYAHYKGVVFLPKGVYKRWKAKAGKSGKYYHGGTFASEIEAAKAYDELAIKLFGKFASLNFPKEAKRLQIKKEGLFKRIFKSLKRFLWK